MAKKHCGPLAEGGRRRYENRARWGIPYRRNCSDERFGWVKEWLGLAVPINITVKWGWALPNHLCLVSHLPFHPLSAAMLKYVLTSILYLVICQSGRAQKHPQRVTKLRVVESAFAEEAQWLVTSNSIKVKVSHLLEEGFADTAFVMMISSIQRDWLLSSFDQSYLSTIKSEYNGKNAPLHGFGYHVAIYKGPHLAVTDIYKYKLICFYIFCQRLNQLLPAAYRIGYTDNYFKR
ncbi:hypothetical protein [Hymenobacter sp. CRA2]|uniref:hypothetical protein n=1 Tax=Hymenobacter sp. CRA2 TaxID=1955620 RepID=UPI001117943E|nr:hypothetical protein [Hymenobacter sp. CRA2]